SEALHGLLADGERNPLLGHLARAAHGMAQLVDYQIVGPRGQALLIAFEILITDNAVSGELHAQRHADAVARTLVGLVADHDHGVRAGPHEPLCVGLLERFTRELARP